MAIFIKNGINYEVIAVDDPINLAAEVAFEIQIIKIYTEGTPIYMVNIYSRGLDQLSLSKISSYITQDNNLLDCVITGDFNAHHQYWGSSDTNIRGRDIWQWVENLGLVLMNDGSPTRLDKGRGIFSHIDLTLASPNISASLAWGVIEDNMGSDHFPLFITLNNKFKIEQNSANCKKFNYDKADWSAFHNLCKDILLEEVYSNDINIFLNKLTKKS